MTAPPTQLPGSDNALLHTEPDTALFGGPGRDRAVVNRLDPVSRNCEVVIRRR